MNATAISKIIKRIWFLNIIERVVILSDCSEDPISDINKCPSIILAVNRIARVIGQIINLIVSISTMKGIRIREVLWGVRCEHISLK
jgi:hypothetical protein